MNRDLIFDPFHSYDNANASARQAAVGRLRDADYILTLGKAYLREASSGLDRNASDDAILAELTAIRTPS